VQKLSVSYFEKDLSRWDGLTASFPLSFPPTNSSVAKKVRMIAALFTASALISDNIMIPCYYPESATASRILKDVLLQQLSVEPCRENMMRALMHSAYTVDEMDAASERAVVATLDEAVSKLGPLLADSDTFRADLGMLLRKFMDAWKLALLSKKLILASAEEDDTSESETMEEFGGTVTPSEIMLGRPKFGVLCLFPRIHVPELDHVVHKGIVLLPWQEIVLAAEREYWSCAARDVKQRNKAARGSNEGAAGGLLIRRERRASVSPSRSWIGKRLFLG